MKLKIIKFILLILVIFSLVACQYNSKNSFYNDNKKIASEANSFSIANYDQKIDGQNIHGTISIMSGMDTIWTYNATEDKELNIKYLIKVNSGKVKLVLISPDKSVTNIVENTKNSDLKDFATSKLNIKKGLNRIKVVVEDNSNFDFDITISEGEFTQLGKVFD